MNCVLEVFRKKFENENKKEAYLNACKWLASNIISKQDLGSFTFEIKEKKVIDGFCFVLILSASVNESELFEGHCTACKTINNNFFHDNEACSMCRAKAYRYRIENKLNVRKGYAIEHLGGLK